MQELAEENEWQSDDTEFDDDASDNEIESFNTYISTENRHVVVKTTDGSIIRGNINLNSESLPMDRVSDLLIKGQNKFLIMYNARLDNKSDAAVIINKSQIVWVMEEK